MIHGTLQKLFVALVVSAVVMIVVLVVRQWSPEEVVEVVDGNSISTETDRPVAPPGERTVVAVGGFLVIDDVTREAIMEIEPGRYLLRQTDSFTIVFDERSDRFTIELQSTEQLPISRAAAEQALVTLVGISERELCQLLVSVTVSETNGRWAPGNYGLSFCPDSVPL